MALELPELVQLSRISRTLRKSDPELARTLSAPPGRSRRPLGPTLAAAVLVVCALSALIALATGSTTVLAIGGAVALTVYPVVLAMGTPRTPRPNSPEC